MWRRGGGLRPAVSLLMFCVVLRERDETSTRGSVVVKVPFSDYFGRRTEDSVLLPPANLNRRAELGFMRNSVASRNVLPGRKLISVP